MPGTTDKTVMIVPQKAAPPTPPSKTQAGQRALDDPMTSVPLIVARVTE